MHRRDVSCSWIRTEVMFDAGFTDAYPHGVLLENRLF